MYVGEMMRCDAMRCDAWKAMLEGVWEFGNGLSEKGSGWEGGVAGRVGRGRWMDRGRIDGSRRRRQMEGSYVSEWIDRTGLIEFPGPFTTGINDIGLHTPKSETS